MICVASSSVTCSGLRGSETQFSFTNPDSMPFKGSGRLCDMLVPLHPFSLVSRFFSSVGSRGQALIIEPNQALHRMAAPPRLATLREPPRATIGELYRSPESIDTSGISVSIGS